MKGKIKKILALISAFAMVSQFAFTLPALADGEYYTQDFESQTRGQKADAGKDTLTLADGNAWRSQYDAGGMQIQKDTRHDEIGLYYRYSNTSGSGGRASYLTLPDAAKKTDDNKKSVMEFDFMMSAGGGGSQMIITDSTVGTPLQNGEYAGSYVLSFYMKDKDTLVINSVNGSDDTYKTTNYKSGTWAHTKAVMDFSSNTVVLTLTSLDGSTTFFEENMVSMSPTAKDSINQIHFYQPRSLSAFAGIDNIVVRPYREGDVLGSYYIVKFDVEGTTTSKTADKTTHKISDVPTPTKTGYLFKGWYKQDATETLYQADDILAVEFSENTTYYAKFDPDPNYVEPMVDIDLNIPTNGLLTMGTADDDFADNNFSVDIIGEIGSDLYEKEESRVDPLKVEWKFDGFTTMVMNDGTSKPTSDTPGEDGTYPSYCDSYATIEYDETNPTVANFKLANQTSNYYGRVTVKVTYGGGNIPVNTITKEAPIAILGWNSAVANQYLPKAGYISDFSHYADDMLGYRAYISSDNINAVDVATGDWSVAGSQSDRSLTLTQDKDTDTKYLALKGGGSGTSCFAFNKIKDVPTGQVIISQDVRFQSDGSEILFKQDPPTKWTDNSTAMDLKFQGGALVMPSNAKVASIDMGKWYHIVMSCDVTSKLWYAMVYDEENRLLGQSDPEPFVNDTEAAPVYLCYRTKDGISSELDFNNVKIYVPTIEGDLSVSVSNDTLIIPSDRVDTTDGIKYADGTVTVNKANAEDGEKAVLVHGTYANDGSLASVKTYDLSFASKKATQAVDAGKGSKFMLWDAIDGMKPIFESIQTDGADDTSNVASLTVEGLSSEHYPIIGKAEWSVVDEASNEKSEFVTITPDETDSHKATLKVLKGASPGTYKVTVTLGGKTQEIMITATGTQESVKFTKSTSSIAIPMDETASDEYTYEAAVVDAESKPIDGKTVTYAMYDKNNKELLADSDGIKFDEATATLTVTSKASPTVVYIRATSTNSDDQAISRSLRVDIHGLAFDFGSTVAAEGYTAVSPTTAWDEATGYGLVSGSPKIEGDASTEDANADSLKGAFKFQAKVTPAKVYNVTVNYSGEIASEYVNADLTGHVYTNANKSSVTYTVPVIDSVLDMTFTAASEVSSIVIEKQDDKKAASKPTIFTIGDSTIANNGSWAYVLNRDQGNYPDLAALASFQNNGRGGRNLSTFYTNGELRDRILTQVRPDDYVVIGCMGTNGEGMNFEGSFNYYVNACETLGAKIILTSYTPHMVDGDKYANVYDPETYTFKGVRGDNYDNIVRKIYTERTTEGGQYFDPNVIGFIDIGQMADDAFNAYVAEGANDAEKQARAQEIIACAGENTAPDHNHYSRGTIACQLMLNGHDPVGDLPGADGIVKKLVEIIQNDSSAE